MEDQFKDIIRQWRTTDSQRMIFGVDMPQTQQAIADLSIALDMVLESVPSFSLVLKDEQMEIIADNNGEEARVPIQLPSMPKLFKEQNVDSITIERGASLEELKVFFTGISMKVDELEKEGGLNGYLEKNGAEHIKADQLKFQLMKDGEQAVNEDEIGGGTGAAGTKKPAKLNKEQTEILSEFILGGTGVASLKTDDGDIAESILDDPKQLERLLKRLVKKQKDAEEFLAGLKEKLNKLGYPEEQAESILKKLRTPKKVMVAEDELARLKEVEAEYKKYLEQRADDTLDQIRKINQKLTDERKRSEAILRQLSQGGIVLNAKGKILSVNETATHVLGASEKELVGKDIRKVLKTHHFLTTVTDWANESDEYTPKAVEVQAADEETMAIIRESAVVIENEEGRSIGVLTALHDVTQQEELKRRKNDILDVLGHDLRAPLGAIRQNFDVLVQSTGLEQDCDEKQKKFLDNTKNNIIRMGKLIEKIMDMRQLETGKIMLKYDVVQPAEVIEQAVHALDEWAQNKKITLNVSAKDLPDIDGDPERLYQVVMNFVSNALKFTPEGGAIEATGEVVKIKGREFIQIAVKDSGMGIPEEDLKRIFDKYEQVTVDTPKGVSGLGLGLSICKTVVELHGGHIWADSILKEGSTFTFQVPVKKSEE